MKPVIGLTTFTEDKNEYCCINVNYINSIFEAGGIAVSIPTIIQCEKDFEAYADMLDGIIFTGGGDIAPRYFGENPLRQTHSISSIRDDYELGLFKQVYEKKIPIMGICRGIQLINVALGGNLYQDVNEQVPGSLGHYPERTSFEELHHSVNISKGSRLYEIFQLDNVYVNSFHHQAVKELGDNLTVAAASDDGIIEAIEAVDNRFLIGVQWHPECLIKRNPMFLELFSKFVYACK